MPANYDLKIYQGATFNQEIIWKDSAGLPVNLTGYSARLQVRLSHSDQNKLLEMTSANGKITLGTTDGKITLKLTDVETTGLTWSSGVYDLEMVSSGGTVTRLMEGKIVVYPEVTR